MPTLTPPPSRTHAAMLAAACEAMCDDTALLVLADLEMEEGESERRVAWLRGLVGTEWENDGTGHRLWTPQYRGGGQHIAFAAEHDWRAYVAPELGSPTIGMGRCSQPKRAAWACLIREGGRA